MLVTTPIEQIYQILYYEHKDPFTVLGIHEIEEGGKKFISIRAFYPGIKDIMVIDLSENKEYYMNRVHADGFFELVFLEKSSVFSYKLKLIDFKDNFTEIYDPYSFTPVLTEFDLHLIQEGTHYKTYEKLGSHIIIKDGIKGVQFAVWAPNAKNVSVIGDFNNWDPRFHQMRMLGSSGIWEIFIPEIGEGHLYKYKVKFFNNYTIDKTDPHGFYSELELKTSSLTYDLEKYKWNDQDWLEKQSKKDILSLPMSIYEVHLGSWMRVPEEGNRFLTYKELAHKLVEYVRYMGYTHIELLPILEHPFYGSWGYQVIGYFSPTCRYGTPEDFMYFVDYCHQNDIGVILDWVPAHFPKDGNGLVYFDGTHLYEHADPRKGEHKDWNTMIFNYGRYEVSNFLLSNALFWLDKYHIDGLRVDAVASMLYLDYSRKEGEWVPNIYGGKENLEAIDFIRRFNEMVYKIPGKFTIAEESTAWPGVSRPVYIGGLGFGFKWNMGWMNDLLEYMSLDPIYRKYHHNKITFALWYAFSENFILVLSHDEVVHGKGSLINKMPGDIWHKFANLRLLYTYQFAHPGKQLMFMGGEFGQWREWNHDSSLDWHLLNYEPHYKLREFVRDLNHLYISEPAMYEDDFQSTGFEWIDFSDWENSIVSFMRKAKDKENILIFVFNFTPVPRFNYRIGVPFHCFYKEILNSDSIKYWGENYGNFGGVYSDEISYQNHPYSINITLPPLGAIVFKPIRERNEEITDGKKNN